MKLELVVMAQSLARLRLEVELAMARCDAALADILAESVASTLPTPDVVSPAVKVTTPAPQTPRLRRRQVYGPGELRAAIMAVYRSVDECSLHDLLARLQAEHPETQMNSLRPCISNLVADGYLRHGEQRGVYRVAEPKRPLSMVK